MPAACSSSVIALLLGTGWTECEVDGRRTDGGSGMLADATEFAVEFFLALEDSARSAAPVVALLIAKFAASGEEAGGGEFVGSWFLRGAGAGAARGFRFAGAPLSMLGVARGLEPARTLLPAAFKAPLIDRSMGAAVGAAAARAFSVFFLLLCCPAALLDIPKPTLRWSAVAVSGA